MSEQTFTKSEVEKALEVVIAGTTRELDIDELSEILEGVSNELRVIIASKLTECLLSLMMTRAKIKRQSDPVSEFIRRVRESREECTRCSCNEEEPEVRIFKNGKPATDDDKDELFHLFKKMLGKD